MSFKEVTSADNATIKRVAKLRSKKYRDEYKEFMAEGILLIDAGMSSDFELSVLVASQSYFSKNTHIAKRYKNLIVTTDRIFQSISDAETPQGILGVFKIPKKADILKAAENKGPGSYIYCDNIRDPGNIGTIIRTADAMGMSGVLLSGGCADIYSPKIIRATMGSIFQTQIDEESSFNTLMCLKSLGYTVITAALYEKSVSLYDYDIPEKTVFVIGNETHGVSKDIIDVSDICVKIPMRGYAESLNAGVAAAIIMSEVSRSIEVKHEK